MAYCYHYIITDVKLFFQSGKDSPAALPTAFAFSSISDGWHL
jgi:hypothetical protein